MICLLQNKLIFTGFILLFILFPGILNAQVHQIRFSKVIDEKGSSPGGTFAITQDSRGFIWFGTVDGLYRYDGYNFRIFRHEVNNPNSLSQNTIRAMCIDSLDRLWIGTQGGGLNIFDISSETFTHYIHTGNSENEPSGNDIWELMFDDNGDLWLGITGIGLNRFDTLQKVFQHYVIVPEESGPTESVTIRSLYQDSDGNIWAGMTEFGLSILDPVTGKIQRFINEENNTVSLSHNELYTIFHETPEEIWMGTYGGGINIFNKENSSFRQIRYDPSDPQTLSSDLVYHAIKSSADVFWIATEYGLNRIDYKNDLYNAYSQDNCNSNSLSNRRLRKIFEDRDGIIWIGHESGVDKLLTLDNFFLLRHQEGVPGTLPKGVIRPLLVDNEDYLWVGVIDNGIARCKLDDWEFYHFSKNNHPYGSTVSNHPSAFFQDSRGNIWIGDWNSGLYLFNREKNNIDHITGYDNDILPLTDNRIQFIRELEPGILLIGTESGLNCYDYDRQEMIQFQHDPHDPNSLSGNPLQANAVIVEENGDLWLGTWSSGLNHITFRDPPYGNPVFTRWTHNPSQNTGLNNNNVISLHRDGDGILWIGTFGGGLNRFDPETGEFLYYTTEDGLSNNVVFSIEEDKSGNLWMSTDNGISKFNPVKEEFITFNEDDGLQGDHFFWGSSFQTIGGLILFGGTNGLTIFQPDSISIKMNQAPMALIDIKLFNESLEVRHSDNYLKHLKLSHEENFLTFEFAALDYENPTQNEYYYMMEGLDNEWIKNDNRRFVTYSQLAPRNYVFKVKSLNDYGIWSEELDLSIDILSPWWQRWWAKLSFFLIIIIFLGGFYFLRIGILEKQKGRLESEVKRRTTEIELQKEELKSKQRELNSQNAELKNTLKSLKETQNQLIQSEKMASLGTLTTGIAHEINNPLNFIAGGIYVIESLKDRLNKHIGESEAERFDSVIHMMREGINRSTNIVKSLKTLAYRGKPVLKPVNINEIINSTLLFLHSRLSDDITIEKQLDFDREIPVFPDKIHQVFLNILDNAIYAVNKNAHDEEKRIRINTKSLRRRGKNYCSITIFNSGPVIPDNYIKHIFDPFYTTKDPGEGTGLGLSISFTIIQEHEGNITAENIDGGVAFTILLPVPD